MEGHEDAKVEDLIEQTTGQWNQALIWNLFSPSHAAAIVKIHLSTHNRGDELLWVPEKSGIFTVKSMYREIVNLKDIPIPPVDASWWKKLWQLKVHERLKISLW